MIDVSPDQQIMAKSNPEKKKTKNIKTEKQKKILLSHNKEFDYEKLRLWNKQRQHEKSIVVDQEGYASV